MVAEEAAKPHESFSATFTKAPAAPGREIESPKFSPNVRSFLPNNLAYFNYKGSLTTPPCSEGVEWIVFTDTISVTPAQVSSVPGPWKAAPPRKQSQRRGNIGYWSVCRVGDSILSRPVGW
jgi:carbonic anhydrase